MSRRGNCWDNAPQESYFGHMIDELNLDTCFTFRDVCNEIKDYIEYYNNYRYQWNLKKMTPVQYRNHLFEYIAYTLIFFYFVLDIGYILTYRTYFLTTTLIDLVVNSYNF